MQRQYNFIYSKLVSGDDDFVGQIAYSIYKKEKVKFIEDFKAENPDKEPQEADFVHFHRFSSTDSAIQSYRLKAELILQEFLNNSLDEAISEATDEIKRNQHSILQQVVEPIKPPGFWMGVWQNTIATFVFSALLALAIIIISVSTEGFWETTGKLFNKEIKAKPTNELDSAVKR